MRCSSIAISRMATAVGRRACCVTALLAALTEARAAEPTDAIPVAPAGVWLAMSLDRLDVEHHWLRRHDRVAWRTGVPILYEHGKRLTLLAEDETHCSAFAAAAADSLDIYLLHPPEHSHVLLANAQFDWLASAAARKAGWQAVKTPLEAQQLANVGELVVAVFKNPDAKSAGHIAIVRPAAISATRIAQLGPQIMQAGYTNYKSAPLASGFDHHPGAWAPGGQGAVKFYAHPIDPRAVAGE
jgi:hypothetical protein